MLMLMVGTEVQAAAVVAVIMHLMVVVLVVLEHQVKEMLAGPEYITIIKDKPTED
jgi:hypothetical protein